MSAGTIELPLAVWMSPMFPVGAFAYSHGLEWAFEAGDLPEVFALPGWLGTLFRPSSSRICETVAAIAVSSKPRLASA